MPPRTIWCLLCHKHVEVRWALPDRCPHCSSPQHWSTDAPTLDQVLTNDDRVFLRSLKITATSVP